MHKIIFELMMVTMSIILSAEKITHRFSDQPVPWWRYLLDFPFYISVLYARVRTRAVPILLVTKFVFLPLLLAIAYVFLCILR